MIRWLSIHFARDAGLIPGQATTILHAVEQLSPRAATTKACVLWNPRATSGEPVCFDEAATKNPVCAAKT